ncbi:Growth_factor receptor cysteine-rich domain superfamily [Hexamita inflata]|uniref:Growth factor receptor cysteine-rich domain superfamily n=1 Tax=Hexamita inflata TaxID=28002 RepID=A0AA86PYL8_9EUKA|nr:Growth factor receptor cysteine-rich domain superfamily [Hexamita inflata]
MIYFFTVYSADVCIGAGQALINSVCVDCWKLGKEVGLDLKSCVKCSDLKVFSPKTLSCEYCDLSSIFIQNQCVCDQNNGFAGANGFFCTDCWKMNQTVVSNTCQPCQSGFIFQDKQCVCDQARGFVNSSGQCVNCYQQKQIIQNGKCAKCEETDPNSVWSGGNCQCVLGYSKVNGICIFDKSKQKVIIISSVISITVVVVLIVGLVAFYCFTKQRKDQVEMINKVMG